jgi:hypothetical protein
MSYNRYGKKSVSPKNKLEDKSMDNTLNKFNTKEAIGKSESAQ